MVTSARRPSLLALVASVMSSPACHRTSPQLAPPGVSVEHADAVEMLLGNELRAARDVGANEPRLGLAGTGIPGDSLGGVVELGKDDCALVLARGTAGVQDVDVFAFGEDGTVLGSDESPAQEANLLLCPPHPARAFVSGRVAAGFGLFAVAAQTVPRARSAAVGERFGISASRPTQPRELDSNWPGLDERLAEHRRRLGGSWESLRKVALPLDPRIYVNVSVEVEADRCIDLLVSPSDEVAHVELEILEASGRWIGSGQARGADRHLMLCSSEQRELLIRCRPHAGRGLAALVVSRSALGARQELADHSARFDLRPPGDLATLREQLASRLERSGYGPATLLGQGDLQPERRTSVPLTLAAGCSRIDVLTAAPLRALRAWLWDGSGQLLSQATRATSGTLFTCGSATSARLDLETAARGGAFMVEARHDASTPAVAERHRLAVGRLLALMDARSRVPSLTRLPIVHTERVSENELARFSLTVPAGRCIEVSAALDRGTSGLEVRLFEETASMTGEVTFDEGALGYGAYAASATLCAVKPARSRLVTAELRANVGQGTALWATHDFDPGAEVKGPQAR